LRLSTWKLVLVLAVIMALQMTSVVIIMPLYARRFEDFSGGVSDLGLSTMAYALTGVLAAPLMGSLADRFGRRPIVMGSLAVFILTFTGFLLSRSVGVFIVLRALSGAFTAGLIPAVMGIVADVSPLDRRAQYIGIITGGASVGWVAGPLIGGLLYDAFDYAVPFGLSIVIAAITLVFAILAVPETHTASAGARPALFPALKLNLRAGLQRALPSIRRPSKPTREWVGMAVLLSVSMSVMFAWAFIEPELMFYAYDEMGWTSAQLGSAISLYGLAMTIGEFTLGRSSDRLGRKPVLILGMVLFSAQFAGLVLSAEFAWIAFSFIVAGLGNALLDPALTASFLDLAPQAHNGRVMGLKSASNSLGSVLGPALVVLLTPFLFPKSIFTISLVLVLLVAAATAVLLPAAGRPRPPFPAQELDQSLAGIDPPMQSGGAPAP